MTARPEMNDATRAQVQAARPDASTWLGANAGSGKTRVLTNRVARLLLGGTNPQRILCLTYTRAAASEMQNRLFETLGEWAMMDNADLEKSLIQLGVDTQFNDDALRQARRLFAQAIETPGGLKIQTIHSFCATLLRRFPLEAGVSPQFVEAEERATDLLRADILDQMADGDDAPLVVDVARAFRGEDFPGLTKEILSHRAHFQTATQADFEAALNLGGAVPPETLPAFVFDEATRRWWQDAVGLLPGTGTTMDRLAEVMRAIDPANADWRDVEKLAAQMLYADRPEPKFSRCPTKKAKTALGPLEGPFLDLMSRTAEAMDLKLRHEVLRQSLTVLKFAQRFIHLYEHQMQARGWLDFDDLIARARHLLSDKAVTQWVLYRIDGGIDHILVDEAQDTSPDQWDVIEALAAEFTAGEGAQGEQRTIFVVGDKKQSIYSFQGADPREFDKKCDAFRDQFEAAGQPFQRHSLAYSFRSSSAVLHVVDQVFFSEDNDLMRSDTRHIAFKTALPGRVDLWPLTLSEEEPDEPDWTDPVDRTSPQSAPVLLAEKIADHIKILCDGAHYIPEAKHDGTLTRRAIRPGDFMILVEKRSPIFNEIIRACKANELPMAGADRLKIGAELAVRDIAALLRFLATPQDSLSLATALRSPLFGWTEQELFTLAHHRKEPLLWPALRNQKDSHPETVAMLHDLRGLVDFMRPYDLTERILTRHEGRKKLIARLGKEAEDGIDALLGQALSYERGTVPSLTGFLSWLQTDDADIKRQIDSASDQIRVMTVHGAKGLEAPIVIMPQTTANKRRDDSSFANISGIPMWKPSEKMKIPILQQAKEDAAQAEEEERIRLLYVAMTRAEKWLIVAGAGEARSKAMTWYERIETAMGDLGAEPFAEAGADGLRYQELDWDAAEIEHVEQKQSLIAILEPVFSEPVGAVPERAKTISPSGLGGAKALPGDTPDDDSVLDYGTLVHKFLEVLVQVPREKRQDIGTDILQSWDLPTKDAALHEALSVLDDPTLAHVFAPDTLAEVPIAARFQDHQIYGEIDRLIVTDTEVTAVDFKTNRLVPDHAQDCPEGLLRQMAAYAQSLAQIYPDRKITTQILWTKTKNLMTLSNDLLNATLASMPDLDAVPDGT